jgi:hypothetical protein
MTYNGMFRGFRLDKIFRYQPVNKGMVMHRPVINILSAGFAQIVLHGF